MGRSVFSLGESAFPWVNWETEAEYQLQHSAYKYSKQAPPHQSEAFSMFRYQNRRTFMLCVMRKQKRERKAKTPIANSDS